MTLINGILGKPLKRAEIASCIGSSSTNVGVLNRTTNSTIIKSFYKSINAPINVGSASDGDMTLAQRREYNWGWGDLGAGKTKIMDTLRAKWNGTTWRHDTPTGGISSSPYRVLDWAGYDKNSPIPFAVTLRAISVTEANGISFNVADIEELEYIHQWGWMSTTKRKVGFGVYIGSSAPSTNGFYICLLAGYNAGLTFEDLLGNQKFSVPGAYLTRIGATNGTYYIIPFLLADTTGISSSAIGADGAVYVTDQMGWQTMIFYQDKLSVTVTPSASPVSKVTASVYDQTVNIDDYSYKCTVTSLQLRLTNRNSTARTVTVSAKPTSGYISGNPTGSFRTVSATVPANSYTTVQLVSGSVSWTMINLAALVDVTITDSDTSVGSSTTTFTIYSDKD